MALSISNSGGTTPSTRPALPMASPTNCSPVSVTPGGQVHAHRRRSGGCRGGHHPAAIGDVVTRALGGLGLGFVLGLIGGSSPSSSSPWFVVAVRRKGHGHRRWIRGAAHESGSDAAASGRVPAGAPGHAAPRSRRGSSARRWLPGAASAGSGPLRPAGTVRSAARTCGTPRSTGTADAAAASSSLLGWGEPAAATAALRLIGRHVDTPR